MTRTLENCKLALPARAEWAQLANPVRRELTCSLAFLAIYPPEPSDLQELETHLPELVGRLEQTPQKFLPKCLALLEDWLLRGQVDWPELLTWMERLAGPPFTAEGRPQAALVELLGLPPAQRCQLARAPDPCLIHFEKLGRRPDKSELVARGLHLVGRRWPDLTLEWFHWHPHQLARMAASVGALEPSLGWALLEHVADLDLFLVEASDGPLLLRARQLLKHGNLPQALADYLEADKEPSPEREQDLRDSLVRHQRLARLEAVLWATRAYLRGKLQLQPGPDLPSFESPTQLERRQLRVALKKWARGESLEDEPAAGLVLANARAR
ncbi:MAG: hypothetical protein AB7S38_07440 [Vulcanimicrobiota bacterium]